MKNNNSKIAGARLNPSATGEMNLIGFFFICTFLSSKTHDVLAPL